MLIDYMAIELPPSNDTDFLTYPVQTWHDCRLGEDVTHYLHPYPLGPRWPQMTMLPYFTQIRHIPIQRVVKDVRARRPTMLWDRCLVRKRSPHQLKKNGGTPGLLFQIYNKKQPQTKRPKLRMIIAGHHGCFSETAQIKGILFIVGILQSRRLSNSI